MKHKKGTEYGLIIGLVMFAIIMIISVAVAINIYGIIVGKARLDESSKNNFNRLVNVIKDLPEGKSVDVLFYINDGLKLVGGGVGCAQDCICLCDKDGCKENLFLKSCFDKKVSLTGGGVSGKDAEDILNVLVQKKEDRIVVSGEMTLSGFGTKKNGADCISSDECGKGYCAKADKKCTPWKDFGEYCNGLADDEDNHVCGRTDESAQCDDSPCGHLVCSDKCVPGKSVGAEGNFCTQNNQCQSKFHCACKDWKPDLVKVMGPNCKEGTCQPKADKVYACDEWNVENDDKACKSGNCNEGRSDNFCK